MRLALDAMGGDHAPAAMVQGAVDYARANPTHEVILVGQPTAIQDELAKEGPQPSNIRIHEATEVIGMADKMTALREKPDDSMNVCARLVKEGQADGMVLCGNTGCSVGAAQLHVRRIKGVKRAGLLTPLPNITGSTWVIDCGANAVARPEHLVQWAEMASVFVQRYESKASPRVGVLSIGSEDAKGVELTTQTLEQVRQTDLNVVGNIEGNDIFNDSVDVVVTDGFTGNVVLKASEGVASALTTIIKEGVKQSFWAKIGALLMKPAFTHLKNRSHWTVVGGVVLLGVDGVVIIGHGKSNRIAVANALKQCARCIDTELLEHLRQMVAGHAAPPRKASFFTSVRKIFGGSGDDDKNPQAEAQE